MNKKQETLKELRENDSVTSLREATDLVRRKQILSNLTRHSQKIGLYDDHDSS